MLRDSRLAYPCGGLVCPASSERRQCQDVAVPLVDLVDETFIAVPPSLLRAELDDPQRWRSWWPELALTVFMDRGDKGIRWSAQGYPKRARWLGSVELWLEPVPRGTVVHHYLRLDPGAERAALRWSVPRGDAARARWSAKQRAHFATAWKRHAWAWKDAAEAVHRADDHSGGTTT